MSAAGARSASEARSDVLDAGLKGAAARDAARSADTVEPAASPRDRDPMPAEAADAQAAASEKADVEAAAASAALAEKSDEALALQNALDEAEAQVLSAQAAHEQSRQSASQAELAHRDAKAKTAAIVAALRDVPAMHVATTALQLLLTARIEEEAALTHYTSIERDEATKRSAHDEAKALLHTLQRRERPGLILMPQAAAAVLSSPAATAVLPSPAAAKAPAAASPTTVQGTGDAAVASPHPPRCLRQAQFEPPGHAQNSTCLWDAGMAVACATLPTDAPEARSHTRNRVGD
jgi:hypothetical protein